MRNLSVILIIIVIMVSTSERGYPQSRIKLIDLAEKSFEEGDYLKAAKYSEKALALTAKEFGTYSKEYKSWLSKLGHYNLKFDKIESASKYFQRALEVSVIVDSGDIESYAKILMEVCYSFMDMGSFDLAEPYMLELEKVFNAPRQKYSRYLSKYGNEYNYFNEQMGVLYFNLGQYERSENYFIEARASASPGARFVNVTLSLAELYAKTKRISDAEKLFLMADSVAKFYLLGTKDSLNLWRTYKCLGRFYMEQGELDKVESYLIKAADYVYCMYLANPDWAECMGLLSHYYYLIGEYGKSENIIYKQNEIYQKSYGKNYFQKYKIYLELAQIMDKEVGVLDYKSNYTALAIDHYRNNIINMSKVLSEVELSKYLESEKYYRNSLITLYYHNWTVDSMKWVAFPLFNYFACSNGLQLRSSSQLNLLLSKTNDSIILDKYTNWKILCKQIYEQQMLEVSKQSPELSNWIDLANNMERELNLIIPELRKQDPSTIDFEDTIFKMLPSDAVAIEYVKFNVCGKMGCEDSIIYGAFVINKPKSSISFRPLFNETRIAKLFEGVNSSGYNAEFYRGAETGSSNNNANSLADSVYNLAIRPLESIIGNAAKIYYSPVGYLSRISFDAMRMNGVYLSDKFELNRMTSVSNLTETTGGTFKFNSIQLFGGIHFELDSLKVDSKHASKNNNLTSVPKDLLRGGGWHFLPGTITEINEIEKILSQNSIVYEKIVGDSATESRFMRLNGASSPSIIHIATHGFFYPLNKSSSTINRWSRPNFISSPDPLLRSGVLMAGANNTWKGQTLNSEIGDGILTAREISNMYFGGTDLVVLSACETGLGDLTDSEGVMGLHRAFKIAGVEYLIISLWQVPDLETSEFMINFYADLLKLKSIPDAFRSTQNKMKEKYQDEPYKWAGFVLVR